MAPSFNLNMLKLLSDFQKRIIGKTMRSKSFVWYAGASFRVRIQTLSLFKVDFWLIL